MVLKIGLKINELSIVVAEAQGYYDNSKKFPYFLVLLSLSVDT